MITFFIITLLIFTIFSINGQLLFRSKSIFFEHLKPVVGASVSVLVFSNLLIINQLSFQFGLLINFILIFFLLNRVSLKKTLFHIFLYSFSLSLLYLPYYIVQSNELNISGFNISNDAVVHALLARGCNNNSDISSKLYLYPELCVSGTPVGSHGIVYLLSKLTYKDTSVVVIPTAIMFVSLNVFVIFSMLFSLMKTRYNHKLIAFLISPFLTATYFYLAIAFHGFLSQSAFVPFVIAYGLILYEESDRFTDKTKILYLGLLAAAATAIYSYVSVLSLLVISGVYILTEKKEIANRAILLSVTVVLTIILMGLNNISLFLTIYDLQKLVDGKSVIAIQSSSLGNLLSYIDSRIGSGFWPESDYRFIKSEGYKSILQFTISSIITAVSVIFFTVLLNRKIPIGKLAASIVLLAFAVYIFIPSPYSFIKIQSLYLLFIPVFFVSFVLNYVPNKLSYLIIFVYIIGILVSNYILMKHLSYLSFYVLENLEKLNDIIGENITLFHTDNDWSIYYNDSEQVDITNIHYLRDYIQRDPSEYQLIIKDSVSEFDENCSNTGNIGNYYYCRL